LEHDAEMGAFALAGDQLDADAGEQAVEMGKRCKAVTDRPVLLGVGISTPEQAVGAAAASDGVVVGSALMARFLRSGDAETAHDFVAELRAALDQREDG
jgi:tryptophan synthase alpha chain